ncbi:hypothetical protein D3C76_1793180 [compost metagenome]
MPIGSRISSSITPGSEPSMMGASQRPARKPRITVGSAAMISTVGLTYLRSPADMK